MAICWAGCESSPSRKPDGLDDLGIIVSVWVDPSAVDEAIDHNILFQPNREATAKALRKAMNHEPRIDRLLKNRANVQHYFHQLAVDGDL